MLRVILSLQNFAQVEQLEEGMPGRLKVTAKSTEGPEVLEEEYNTVSISGFEINGYRCT